MSRYLVWNEDETRGVRVNAMSAEWAAEEWAKIDDYESAEYSIANGSEVVVSVEDVATGEVVRFNVRGRIESVYTAYKVL